MLVRVGRIAGRVTRVSETRIEFEPVLSGLRAIGDTHLLVLRAPVSERTLSDLQIAVLEEIRRLELTDRKINWSLFVSSDSSDAMEVVLVEQLHNRAGAHRDPPRPHKHKPGQTSGGRRLQGRGV